MISIITTINPPTKAVKELATKANVIVIGDKKTPQDWKHEGCYFYNLESQNNLEYSLKHYLPENHYARKNMGYLIAIKSGTEVIYESDDDNVPNYAWQQRAKECDATVLEKNGWLNAYNCFTTDYIWPRGYSLKHLAEPLDVKYPLNPATKVTSHVQQGLADNNADVDAVWRLILNKETMFSAKRSVMLSKGAWCPFNSQSTWWFKEAYPLLYLPVNASFRMTDIWRSFVAQKCLWEMGYGVTFHSPAEVYQERNPHDLLKDFEDEIPGYLNNDKIVETLAALKLTGDIFQNLTACYQSIVDIGVLPESEMRAVNAWVKDVKEIWKL